MSQEFTERLQLIEAEREKLEETEAIQRQLEEQEKQVEELKKRRNKLSNNRNRLSNKVHTCQYIIHTPEIFDPHNNYYERIVSSIFFQKTSIQNCNN